MNYAIFYRGGPDDRWHRWAVCEDPIEASRVLDHLLETKGVYAVSSAHTTDAASPRPEPAVAHA